MQLVSKAQSMNVTQTFKISWQQQPIHEGLRTMTNVNQASLPRLSKAPLVRASLVKRRYIKYLALPFFM